MWDSCWWEEKMYLLNTIRTNTKLIPRSTRPSWCNGTIVGWSSHLLVKALLFTLTITIDEITFGEFWSNYEFRITIKNFFKTFWDFVFQIVLALTPPSGACARPPAGGLLRSPTPPPPLAALAPRPAQNSKNENRKNISKKKFGWKKKFCNKNKFLDKKKLKKKKKKTKKSILPHYTII